MSWSIAPARSRSTGRIKAQTCSGSSAQCQQPAAGLPVLFILCPWPRSVLKGLKESNPANRAPLAREKPKEGQVCSNMISNCFPKEGRVLHSGPKRCPVVVKRRKTCSREDENMPKIGGRASVILVECLLSPRNLSLVLKSFTVDELHSPESLKAPVVKFVLYKVQEWLS